MKITVDTNVLVRAAVEDDPSQTRAAIDALKEAEMVAVRVYAICEFVWVLQRVYRLDRVDVGIALAKLLAAANVVINRPAVEAGLTLLQGGGDFADGLIAYDGAWLGGEVFVSFDKRAVTLLSRQGRPSRLLGE